MFDFENEYSKKGYKCLAGVDEAGRGPLAGPVCVASVIMPLDKKSIIKGVNDSKKLTEKQREELFEKIIKVAIDYNVTFINEKEIDEINILNATKKGVLYSLNNLKTTPDMVLVDYINKLDIPFNHIEIVKGDSKSYSIACASILAKVSRDRLMIELDKKYPIYDFKSHKGYGTKKHIELIKKYGKCEIHRNSFIKNFVGDV